MKEEVKEIIGDSIRLLLALAFFFLLSCMFVKYTGMNPGVGISLAGLLIASIFTWIGRACTFRQLILFYLWVELLAITVLSVMDVWQANLEIEKWIKTVGIIILFTYIITLFLNKPKHETKSS